MDTKQSESKSARILSIYARLNSGMVLKKSELAEDFHVTERSIQRDIDSLRSFMDKEHLEQSVIYDARARGYKLINRSTVGLSNHEILAVCKILLESRSMRTDEMFPILDKLIECAAPKESQQLIKNLVANEKHHYIPPHHGKLILNHLWEIGEAVRNQQIIEIQYNRLNKPAVKRSLKPVGLMFSEYYFYLTAFQTDEETRKDFDNPDDIFPTIYRIDRIKSVKVTNEHFHVPYAERFEEGEFRKRIQFMFGGELRKILFLYKGLSIEAVLDRFPTAEIVRHDETGWLISAEVYGDGVDMWLRGQGDTVEVIDDGKMKL